MTPRHAANGFAGAKKAPEDVRGEDALKSRCIHVFETRLKFYGASIVNQRCQRAQLPDRFFEETNYIGFIANVGSDGDSFAPFLLDALTTSSAASRLR